MKMKSLLCCTCPLLLLALYGGDTVVASQETTITSQSLFTRFDANLFGENYDPLSDAERLIAEYDPFDTSPYVVSVFRASDVEEVLAYISSKDQDVHLPTALVSRKTTWKNVKKIFFIQATRELVELLQSDPQVSHLVKKVEPDFLTFANEKRDIQWGQDRIDQSELPLDGRFKTRGLTGKGQIIYLLDSGVKFHHTEFGDNLVHGWDFVDDDANTNDKFGHGTAMASLLIGRNKGVAPGATLVSVRVLDSYGAGSISTVIEGIDWIIQDASTRSVKGSIINLSASGRGTLLNDVIEAAYDAGILTVGAAGSSNTNACDYAPGSAPTAVTVGALTDKDEKTVFSNWGNCVDIWAPGMFIEVADYRSKRGFKVMSGTSISAAHVSGALALVMEKLKGEGEMESIDDAVDELFELGEEDVIVEGSYPLGSNLLLQVPKGPKGKGKGKGKKRLRKDSASGLWDDRDSEDDYFSQDD